MVVTSLRWYELITYTLHRATHDATFPVDAEAENEPRYLGVRRGGERRGELHAPEEVAEQQGEVLRLRVRMHCSGCATKIGSALPQIEGVRSAVADAERGEVEVVHLPSQVSEGEVRDHLRELGFHVEGHATEGKVEAR